MPQATTYQNALSAGTQLNEYRLDAVLGAGAFGMTYLARDSHLDQHVAIKEYLPTDMAVRALDGSVVPITNERGHDYQWGLDRFLLEARTLARFNHPNIVRVRRYFEANGTAYVVMDYENGASLVELLKAGPPPVEAGLRALLMPLLDGLETVHQAGYLHRDIKPANVFIRSNGTPVLIDFGAARQALGGATRSLTAVLTPGYAPLEQYSSEGDQGPWTDLYALAGVLYRALLGENPPDATSRVRRDLVPEKLATLRGRVSLNLLNAMQWALTMNEQDRPRCVPEWRAAIQGQGRPPTVTAAMLPQPAAAAAAGVTRAAVPEGAARAPRRRPPVPPVNDAPMLTWPRAVLAVLIVTVVWLSAGRQPAAPVAVAGAGPDSRSMAVPARPPQEVANGGDSGTFLVPPEPARAAEQGAQLYALPQAALSAAGEDRDLAAPDARGLSPQPGRRPDVYAADRVGVDGRPAFLPREEPGRLPPAMREHLRADLDGDGRISPREHARLRRLQREQRAP